MNKIKNVVLMLCLLFSGAFCYAHGKTRTEKKGDGTPIEVIEKACHEGEEKGSFIIPSVNGHVLTVVFSMNLGQVSVEITTDTGAMVDCVVAQTPNGLQFYISNAGSYIVNFTLPNGDEYYGEFEVTE